MFAEIFSNADIWGEKGAEAQEIFYQIYPRLQQGDAQLVSRFERISGTKLTPLTVYEGAKEIVSALKMQMPQTRIVLLGAKSEQLLKKEVLESGFDGLFDMVLGNIGNPITDKPNKGAFDRAVQLQEGGMRITKGDLCREVRGGSLYRCGRQQPCNVSHLRSCGHWLGYH